MLLKQLPTIKLLSKNASIKKAFSYQLKAFLFSGKKV